MDFSGRALFYFWPRLFFSWGSGIRAEKSILLGLFAFGTSAHINIHRRLFGMLSLGTGAADELCSAWSSGLHTRVSLDQFSLSSTPVSISPCSLVLSRQKAAPGPPGWGLGVPSRKTTSCNRNVNICFRKQIVAALWSSRNKEDKVF